MPVGPLKKIRPDGLTCTEWTLVGAARTIRGRASNPVRAAFRSTARIEPVSTSPKTRSPLRLAPRPHRWQNAAPVMPIVEAKEALGRCRGVGPELFVPAGLGSPQLSLDPQPKLAPFMIRLIS